MRGGWVCPTTSLDAITENSQFQLTECFLIIPKYSILTIFCAYYFVCNPLVCVFDFTVHLYGALEALDELV
jgi:hypothetical protein